MLAAHRAVKGCRSEGEHTAVRRRHPVATCGPGRTRASHLIVELGSAGVVALAENTGVHLRHVRSVDPGPRLSGRLREHRAWRRRAEMGKWHVDLGVAARSGD